MKILFWCLITLSVLPACKQNNDTALDVKEMAIEAPEQMNTVTADTAVYYGVEKDEDKSKTGTNDKIGEQPPVATFTKSDWDKKIIKQAHLRAEVKEHKRFSNSITEKVKAIGGYIAGEQQSGNEYRIETTITIKVPVHQFENGVASLLDGVTKVEEKRLTSDDVTTEYVDGKSRLEAKKAVRLRYLELLKAAKNMEDIIAVQKEINEIQEEIELVAGRINYLGQSSAMSTIEFTYYQVLDSAPVTDGNSFAQQLKTAFAGGWHWMGVLMIGLVSIWPLFVLLMIVFMLLKRKALLKFK